MSGNMRLLSGDSDGLVASQPHKMGALGLSWTFVARPLERNKEARGKSASCGDKAETALAGGWPGRRFFLESLMAILPFS